MRPFRLSLCCLHALRTLNVSLLYFEMAEDPSTSSTPSSSNEGKSIGLKTLKSSSLKCGVRESYKTSCPRGSQTLMYYMLIKVLISKKKIKANSKVELCLGIDPLPLQ